MADERPNVVFVFGDQWRYQATGFAGDPNVKTPHLDRLADQCLNFELAISGSPVCSPARASLLTGQYPLTHGVFLNDVPLDLNIPSMGEIYKRAGYDTAYIGKWHINEHGRAKYIPRERRRGFDYWRVLECTHNYNKSPYYADDDPTQRTWEGYDAIAQTRDAQQYIRDHAGGDKPFALVLSWGPPHNPYETAPQEYRDLYDPQTLTLPPNVPTDMEDESRRDLAGYYAHCSALDACVGDLRQTIEEAGIDQNTIFVFWSDHGDMLCSNRCRRKQWPHEESIHVPLLVRWLARFEPRTVDVPINTPDLLPTLLGLCGIDIPDTVEGSDYAPYLRGEAEAPAEAVLLACYNPFSECSPSRGGRAYRGLRTKRYTYARCLEGPWLLFDNVEDPYQQQNLLNQRGHKPLLEELDAQLNELLKARGDEFLPPAEYLKRWGYGVDSTNAAPYSN